MADQQRTDLVLEGGGVKGIALAGAVSVLAEAGYTFPRIAGTSAGAIAGAVLVGLDKAGEPPDRLAEVARTLDYDKFRDRGLFGRLLGPLQVLADGMSLALENGVFEGEYLHDWIEGVLADLGVHTFGDLRTDDPDSALPPEHAYRLVVTASDLSRQKLVCLPWDYPDYGLDPDEQSVADAIRASASIPFFFEPVTMRGRDGVSTLVDGGLLSNYPITIFDRDDGRPSRWPTIGVRLTGRPSEREPLEEINGPISFSFNIIDTLYDVCQSMHVDNRCNVARSVFVDTAGVSPTDFDIEPERLERLYAEGREAATAFLASWDFDAWARECAGRTRADE